LQCCEWSAVGYGVLHVSRVAQRKIQTEYKNVETGHQ
jgi:hypothetical protein